MEADQGRTTTSDAPEDHAGADSQGGAEGVRRVAGAWTITYGDYTLRFEDLSVGFLYQVKDFAGIPTGPDEWDILSSPQRSVTVLTAYVSCLIAQREGITVEAAAMQVMALHPIELMACYRGSKD